MPAPTAAKDKIVRITIGNVLSPVAGLFFCPGFVLPPPALSGLPVLLPSAVEPSSMVASGTWVWSGIVAISGFVVVGVT